MTNKKLQYGLVGAGSIAQAYAEAFQKSETAELAAVTDIRAEASAGLSQRNDGCKAFDSVDAMVEAVQPDAVVICTPPATHESISISLLQRGINVLCEKPLTIGVDSARRMIEAAQAAGSILTMASKFRYVEDVIAAREIIDSGIIGEVILFENAFTSQVNMLGRWNSEPEISGGGVLIDNGTHSLDLTRYFLGPLADVQVVEGKRVQGLAVEETVRVFVKSLGGAMGNIDLSWSINKELDSYINIYGTDGTIRIGWKESKYKISGTSEWRVFGTGYDKVKAFVNQIDNFSRAALGLEPLRINGVDALASVEVIDAAYAALRQSQWTSVGQKLFPNSGIDQDVLEIEGVEKVA
jgi:predicted dehydrogenase